MVGLGSRVVSWLVLRVCGMTLILDIGNVATIAVGVSLVIDNLGAAVRQGNSVRSGNNFGVGSLLLGKGSTGVVVLDSILVGVRLGGLIVGSMVGGGVTIGWWPGWKASGRGHKGCGSNDGLGVHVERNGRG